VCETFQCPISAINALLSCSSCHSQALQGTERAEETFLDCPPPAFLTLTLPQSVYNRRVHFGLQTYDDTKAGLAFLGITANGSVDRLRPAIIATAAAVLGIMFLALGVSAGRGAVQAAHDRTARADALGPVWMFFSVLTSLAWWAGIAWLLVMTLASLAWVVLLYVARGGLAYIMHTTVEVPSLSSKAVLGSTCQPACLHLSYLQTTGRFNVASTCVCDRGAMQAASNSFADAEGVAWSMLVGFCVMVWAAVILLVNLACQYASTTSEREYLLRATTGVGGGMTAAPGYINDDAGSKPQQYMAA
jgi:hypothetical protein